jgi:hypothetical protein
VCPTFETEPCELLDWQATQRGLLGFAETPLGGKSGTRCRLPGEQAFVRMEQLLQREEKQRSQRAYPGTYRLGGCEVETSSPIRPSRHRRHSHRSVSLYPCPVRTDDAWPSW